MPYQQKYYQKPGHIIAAGIALPIVDIIAVTLRFWTRHEQKQAFKTDDWLTIPAALMTTGIGICLVYGVSQEAFGYTIKIPPDLEGSPLDLETYQLSVALKLQWAFTLMLPLALGCVKASFLFFYMRIFSINKRSAIHFLLVGMNILVLSWTIAIFFAEMLQCGTRFWANWSTLTNLDIQCTETTYIALGLAITDFVIDVVIIGIPIPLIWQLNLSRTKKLALIAVFLLGIVTVAASLVRLIVITRLVTEGYDSLEDGFFQIATSLYWGMIESGIGVFAACLPTLQFFIRAKTWKGVINTLKSFSTVNLSVRRLLASRESRRGVYINDTADVAYSNKDSHPILSKSASWTHHGRSEGDLEVPLENISTGRAVQSRPTPC